MNNLIVKVEKRHDDAVLPKSAHESDAGFDLVAIDDGEISDDGYIQYDTGIAVQPPEGYHTEIFPRSSISKYDLVLANSIGLVDESYRGNILVRFKHVQSFSKKDESPITFSKIKKYKKGDKIAQLVLRKTNKCEFIFVEKLSETERASGGFGSTDKKSN